MQYLGLSGVIARAFLFSLVMGLLSACGDSALPTSPDTPTTPDTPTPEENKFSVSPTGVDGPMLNADVSVYKVDISQPGFKGGAAIDTGTTNAATGVTEGISITAPADNDYFLFEFTSNANTKDMTTGQAPVLSALRTIISGKIIKAGTPFYATSLTTVAVQVAETETATDIAIRLENAANKVISTVGFGVGSDIDIFSTSPVINNETTSQADIEKTATYRAAAEALVAVVHLAKEQSTDTTDTADDALAALGSDLADDGEIDVATGSPTEVSLSTEIKQIIETIDPEQLIIPNTTKTVKEVGAVLKDETSQTGTTTDASSLDDQLDVEPAQTNPDLDADGVINALDAFPNDASETVDFDGDGIGDNADTDDDNDGVEDSVDAFPKDAAEWLDTDNDGTGNNADTDDDNDGVADSSDDFPLDSTISNANDQDADGWPAGQDADDNDNTVPGTPFVDTDGDGNGDQIDDDDDNDGVNDSVDAFPTDPNENADNDNDGIGDRQDLDDDNDSISDIAELRNGTNPLLADSDSDSLLDPADNCPIHANTDQLDTDTDGKGDACDIDDDNDSIRDISDNCPIAANTDQANADDNGNVCDDDDDNDNVLDAQDAFPLDATESVDTDNDGTGTNADTDDDNDGVVDASDAFPLDATDQLILTMMALETMPIRMTIMTVLLIHPMRSH